MRVKQAEWKAHGAKRIAFYHPPSPSRSFTREQLADWSLIINGSGPYVMREDERGPLAIPAGYPGAGRAAVYGYLTPAEVEALHSGGKRAYRQAAE